MSAYRQAMLSVAPERVEQFSLELKQNIDKKKSKKKSSDHHKHRHNKDKKTEKKKGNSTRKEKSYSNSSSSKRKKVKDHSTNKKIKTKSDDEQPLTDDSDIEENGLDLNCKLFPLSHYVKDRQQLSDILFSIVKGPKLKAMLPDILKDMSEDELKQKCFAHLEVMSSKRIVHILAGESMQSSSGTDSETEGNKVSSNNEALPKVYMSNKKTEQKHDRDETASLQTNFVDSTTSSGCEVLSLLAAGSFQENQVDSVLHNDVDKDIHFSDDGEVVLDEEIIVEEQHNVTQQNSYSADTTEIINECATSDIEEEVETVEIEEDEEYTDMVDAILEETLPNHELSKDEDSLENQNYENTHSIAAGNDNPMNNKSNLSQLELLELQLRARAIKSLMKAAQENNNSS